MTLTVPSDLWAEWLRARADYDAAMRDGPASRTPYVSMRTEQLRAVRVMAAAAMRVLMSVEVANV